MDSLPPPPKGQVGLTLQQVQQDSVKSLPPPPQGQKSYTIEEARSANNNFFKKTTPSFPASVGGAETVLPNIAKTFGNIPSSARDLTRAAISPVNPFDTESPLNIGANIVKSAKTLGGVIRENGVTEGAKLVGQGFADTARKGLDLYKGVGEKIYGNLERNTLEQGSARSGTGRSAEQLLTGISKVGIEDPLLIPSLLYAPSKGATNNISRAASPFTRGVDTSLANIRSTAIGKVKSSLDNYGKNAVSNDVAEVLSGKALARRSNELSKQGVDLQSVLSQPSIVKGLKVENKKIIPDEAIAEIQSRVDTMLDAKRSMLPDMDKVAPLTDREVLRRRAYDSVQGGSLPANESALTKAIDRQINALPERLSPSDLDSIRAKARKDSRDAKGQLRRDTEYAAIETAAKNTLFDVTDNLPVPDAAQYKAINDYIRKNISVIEFLDKNLRNTAVKGGKLGGMTARLAGTVAGSSGGPIASLLTGYGAGLISDILVDSTLGNSMKLRLIRDISGGDEAVFEQAQKLLKNISNEANRVESSSGGISYNPDVPNGVEMGTYKFKTNPDTGREELLNSSDVLRLPAGKEIRGNTTPTINLPQRSQSSIDAAERAKRESGVIGTNQLSKSPANQQTTTAISNVVTIPKNVPQNLKSANLPMAIADKGVVSFKGFTDLSTRLLEKLKGRATVSKTFISDLVNSADLKQPEKDLIRGLLKDQPDTVAVNDFANKVKTELLPLKITEPRNISKYRGQSGRYETITLPDELRGPVANYQERVYESPIKTSAGDVHFSTARGGAPENYFAHSRIEDLPEVGRDAGRMGELRKKNLQGKLSDAETKEFYKLENADNKAGKTRRVIEIQSDLFQKGRLENEAETFSNVGRQDEMKWYSSNEQKEVKGFYDAIQTRKLTDTEKARWTEINKNAEAKFNATENKRLSPLEPYRNTWHERVIREEVKQAAKDGKNKLQFPTGETAMKIEGLGDNTVWSLDNATNASPDELKIGKEIYRGSGDMGTDENDAWIITDVLGDGKFKAIDKMKFDDLNDLKKQGENSNRIKELIEQSSESFDISGKVDTGNPIYKFYEKEVGKYLKNKYGATLITDPQGVKWWQVDIKPEMKKIPVEAFGALGIPALGEGKE